MEKVNVNIPADYNGNPIIIKVLEGENEKPLNLRDQKYNGDIFAVESYSERDFVKKDAIVLVSEEKRTITLIVCPNHPHAVTVEAVLQESPEFKKFFIETTKRFSINELSQLIRTNRFFFPDIEAYNKLLMNLKKLDLKITQTIQEEDDSRGNTKNLLETNVISNIDERFTLEMPIFKGLQKYRFEVFICIERRDKGVSLWLESPEAIDIGRSAWLEILDSQVAKLKSKGLTVINS